MLRTALADPRGDVRLKRLRRGEVLRMSGATDPRVFVVLGGALFQSTTVDGDGRACCSLRGPGEILGLLPFLDGEPEPVETRALIASSMTSISFETLRDHVERSPPFALALAEAASREARRAETRLAETAGRSVPRRLASALVDLALRFGMPAPRGTAIDLPLVQEDLAALLGVTRETVSRHLANFTRQDWVRVDCRRYIVDLGALDRFGPSSAASPALAAGTAP